MFHGSRYLYSLLIQIWHTWCANNVNCHFILPLRWILILSDGVFVTHGLILHLEINVKWTTVNRNAHISKYDHPILIFLFSPNRKGARMSQVLYKSYELEPIPEESSCLYFIKILNETASKILINCYSSVICILKASSNFTSESPLNEVT